LFAKSENENNVEIGRGDSFDSIMDNGCTSPTKWICEFSQEAIRPFFPKKQQSLALQQMRDPQKIKVASNQRVTSRGITTSDSSSEDDDDIISQVSSLRAANHMRNQKSKVQGSTKLSQQQNQHGNFSRCIPHLNRSVDDSIVSTLTSAQTENSESSDHGVVHTPGGTLIRGGSRKSYESSEPRIVAPNVGKLSPISVVEVKLQAQGDRVVVLCSVDVLKMYRTTVIIIHCTIKTDHLKID
jgi:hypothetical protein